MKNAKWLSLVEYLVLIGSGAGSIASIASQQLAFTAAPVSCLLLLNLVNRRRLDKETLKAANTNIAHLDRRLSDEIKGLDQQVRTLPSFVDLASVRKTIQQRHDNEIAQLQHSVSHRLSAIENRDFDQLEQELSYLKTKYSQLSESLATVSQYLGRLATNHRVEGAENTIGQLRTEVAQLHSKITDVATSQKQVIPRVMQDEIHQIHRRLNSLPQPFDATALKQEVDGLVKVVGDLVPRRDMAKLMAEVEKIRQQHQTLEQTVAPLRSVNTIMRKQMDTLSSWVATGHPASPTVDIEKLQTTVTQLEERLNTVSSGANLAELHTEMQTMLNGHLDHLQAQFNSVQHYTQNLDRQQKHLTEWMGRLPEMLDASALQTQIKYLTSRLEVTENQLAELVTPAAKSEYELMFDLSQKTDPFENTRTVLKEALNSAKSRIIVVFPYPDRATLDDELIRQFQTFLDRGGSLDIGWGHLGDEQVAQQTRYIHDREAPSISKNFLRKILSQLTQLKHNYPTQFRFKVLGTSENFLVCDSTYSILGLHPVATASTAFPEIAIGLRTQNATVIQGLVDRFDNPVLENNPIAYLNRAITRYELGDRQGAIDDYSSAIKLDSKQSVAYNNRALIKFELGDHAGAIADLNRAVISNAHNPVLYCNRGVIWLQIGEKVNAIDDFSYALQVDPACLNAYVQRGLARLRFENKLGAIDDFTAMLTIDAQNAVAYFHRGLARSTMNDKTGAIRDLKEAAWLFSVQGDQAKHQHAIEAIQKLRKRFVSRETTELHLVREA
ncbi:MAG: tetratricopeptide repeat protein [Phormidium tanganyikae FI6-MK23]|jgi:tetratricopeptide (TPR) repeat protein|nr:tetratricopeptide repeat protein [Phormidium tanganyikae FI6-MK23]